MPQRSSARADARVPVRVLPKARALIQRAAFEILADVTLRLAGDATFAMSDDVARALQSKGHVELLDRHAATSSAREKFARALPARAVRAQHAPSLPSTPAKDDPAFAEWARIALARLTLYSKRNEETGCLLWQRPTQSGGYGGITYRCVHYTTHRLSWIIHRGPIPAGMMVCHSCDNRACIEIDHLFLGTAQDNIRDMVRKGRGRFYGGARLTRKAVAEIKRRLEDGHSIAAVSKETSLCYSAIHNIKSGRAWRDVEVAACVEDGQRKVLRNSVP